MTTPGVIPTDADLSAPMPAFLRNWAAALGVAPRAEAAAPSSALVVSSVTQGVGLPPPNSPFWQRPDVAEKVLQAVAALESERARLARQASESMDAERSLTREVEELRVRTAPLGARISTRGCTPVPPRIPPGGPWE